MIPWVLLVLSLPALAAVDKTHGAPPSLLASYIPTKDGSQQTWTCLDGSKVIPWSAVNDDYCDCSDGSDEPGTGACPGTRFYCKNEGHIGAFIPSSRVRDGLCEVACCDGSDEAPGTCPNKCKEFGEAYRAKQEAERKLRKTGSKIRATYVAFAQKEKKRIEGEVSSLEKEIETREKEVARLKDVVDHAESISAAALEHKKQSPLYLSLLTHHSALKSLQREHKKHLEREKQLGDILDRLRTGYNPNYQDMAVLEAVRGWESLAGLPHINDVKKDEESAEAEEDLGEDEAEELEPGMWTALQLEHQLDGLLNQDYETLLLQHDKHVGGAEASGSDLLNLSAYIPDQLLPQYEAFRDALVSGLELLGIVKASKSEGADASRAKQAYNDAEHSLKLTKEELETAHKDLEHLFDPAWFGKGGEWKKLDGTCLELDAGDYTYEICLFDEARQKPKKGGSTFSLGRFNRWNTASGVEVGTPEYYKKQYYTRGTKCWNGPERSVVLELECGTENKLLTVAELEKCEYRITGTSPALCLPPENVEKPKEEL